MKKRYTNIGKIHFAMKWMLASMFSFIALSVNAQENSTPCTFVEEDGLLIVEMESAVIGDSKWREETAIEGYTGTSYLNYYGDRYTYPEGAGIETLTYNIKINKPGRYRFQMHSLNNGTISTESNDVWLRFPQGGAVLIDGDEVWETPDHEWMKVIWGGNLGEWNWTTNGEDITHVYVDFEEAGEYTVEFSGRSENFNIDRFTLYHSETVSTYFSLDLSAPESERVMCENVANNDPIVVLPQADSTCKVTTSFLYTIPENAFRDKDWDSLSYSAAIVGEEPLPEWMSFEESEARTLAGVPQRGDIGAYDVVIFADDGNGGSTSDTVRINVVPQEITAISSTSATNDFNIYPNPAHDILHATGLNGSQTYDLTVLDATGKVKHQDVIKGEATINLQEINLSDGMYFLMIQASGGEVKMKKTFIKK